MAGFRVRRTVAPAAVAAMPRTSQVVTITTRSAPWTAHRRRGRLTRYVTDHCGPTTASRIHHCPHRSGIDVMECSGAGENRRPTWCGSTSFKAAQLSRPLCRLRSGQRRPGDDSPPTTGRSPPRVEIHQQRLPCTAPARRRTPTHPAAGAGGNRDDPTTMDSQGTRLGVRRGDESVQIPGWEERKHIGRQYLSPLTKRLPKTGPARSALPRHGGACRPAHSDAPRPRPRRRRSGEPDLPSRELRPGYPRADRRHDALSARGQLRSSTTVRTVGGGWHSWRQR